MTKVKIYLDDVRTPIDPSWVVVKSVTGDRYKVGKLINPDYSIFSEKHNVGDSH
jgi:hypothetical protein